MLTFGGVKPTACYGNEFRYLHAACCRKGRPACKRRRVEAGYLTCECPSYRFPHRLGSGACYASAKRSAA